MLKIYKVHNYVSIDGADWREVLWSGCLTSIERKVSDEPLETQHILCNASFYEAYDYIHDNRLDGVYNSSDCWCRMIHPVIKVRYRDACDDVTYRRFISMSYKIEYEEWKEVTLEWIMKNLPADQTIQYLKERGITTCPMNF